MFASPDIGAEDDGAVTMEFRLDNRKIQTQTFARSTDYSAVFLNEQEFDNLLFGHIVPHKTHSSPPVHALIAGVDELDGAEVEMEWRMPDPTAVGNACGAIVYPWTSHKKRR
ncbi:MAG: hypothetical protein ACRD1Y_05885 [Terriglobales bacterium]